MRCARRPMTDASGSPRRRRLRRPTSRLRPARCFCRSKAHELERLVRPEFSGLPARPSGLYALALQMGYPPASEVSCDFLGFAQSFAAPAGYPRYAAIVEKLTAMGYPPDARGGVAAWVKYERAEDGGEAVPAGRLSARGSAFRRRLRGGSCASPISPTIRNAFYKAPDYRKLDAFRRLEGRGYDGVVIDEFRQSENFLGDVGHRSIGLFASALGKIRCAAIPARHFDWPENGVRPAGTSDVGVRRGVARCDRWSH